MSSFKFVVLYGSETGTAQDVAERIWKEAKTVGLCGPVQALDDYPISQLPFETLAIFVCSTTGQGDQPTNMKNFWKFLLRKNLPLNSLQNLSFAVLGLGDSSYVKFNHAGKKLFRRLEMLGGRSLIEPGWADDQHDLGPDAVVDPWINQLMSRLTILYPQLSIPDVSPPLTSKWFVRVEKRDSSSNQPDYRLKWPLSNSALWVRVQSNTRTTPQEHFQDVRVIKFESPEELLCYSCGDVAVVRPSNSGDAIESLLEALPQMNSDDIITVSQKDPDMPVPQHLTRPSTFLELATHYWDLNAVPRRSVLQIMSRLDVGESEDFQMEKDKLAELCSAAGQEDYFAYCTRPRRSVVELLKDFPHTASALPPEYLFDILQPIRQRMFSIASPPQKRYVELLVAVVKYKTRLVKPRLGLCSNWLASLAPGDLIHMDIRTGSLKFPKQGHLLMIGPGTGVAPFRSYVCSDSFREFVSSRWAEKDCSKEAAVCGKAVESGGDSEPNDTKSKPASLVFGCRNSAADFHFKENLVDRPDLQLFTAFSRDQSHKIYVQHVIEENTEYFGRLLFSEDTHVMVAGNAKEMPEAVRQAFITCLEKTLLLNRAKAEETIESKENKGLYQTETWS